MINLDNVVGAGANARADTMFDERGGPYGMPRLSAVASGTGRGSNLVTNGSFNADLSGWTVPSYGTTQVATSPHSGAGCLRLEDASGTYFGYVTQRISTTAGKAYSLALWTRQTASGLPCTVSAEWRAADGTGSFGYMTGSSITSLPFTTQWALYVFEGVAPVGSGQLMLTLSSLSSAGPGVVFIDDVSLTEITDSEFGAGVQRLTATRELSGDLPEQATLVGGAVSADVKITSDLRDGIGPHPASDEDRRAWLGKRVKIAAGFTNYYNDPPTNAVPLQVPVINGVLRTIGFDEGANDRSMTVMENSDQMRATVTVAPYGSTAPRLLPQATRRYPTNLTALIVSALHASGIRVTPPPSADVLWSAPLVAGCLADVGCTVPEGGGIAEGAAWLVDGPFGKRPKAPAGSGFNIVGHPNRRVTSAPVGIQFEAWFYATGTPETSIANISVSVDRDLRIEYDGAGQMSASLYNSNNGILLTAHQRPVSSGWHHVAARVTYGASSQLDLRIDGAGTTPTTVTGITFYDSAVNFLQCQVNPDYVQQVSLHAKTVSSWLDPSTIAAALTTYPQADLDLATLEVDWLAGVDAQVAWELAKEIAAAELGMVGFDENRGRFYFKNRATLNGPTTPVASIGVDVADNLQGSSSIDSVRDAVTTTVTRRWFVESGAGGDSASTTARPAYQHGAALTIPTGTTEFLITVPAPLLPDSVSVVRPSASGMVLESTSMVLCNDDDGVTRYSGSLVWSSIHFVSPTVWKLVTVNASGAVRYAVWPVDWNDTVLGLRGGQGSLIIMGRAASDEESRLESTVKVGTGSRTLELAASVWRDNVTKVTALATQLLASLRYPRLKFDDITYPADLRLQVGDPVAVTDWTGRVPSTIARVTRLVTVIGVDVPDGMAQTVSLRTL